MNKIINIQKENDLISFKLHSDKSLQDVANIQLIVDEFCNYSNITNSDSTKHNYVFNSSNSNITFAPYVDPSVTSGTFTYLVGVKNDIIKDMDDNLKYLKLSNKYDTDKYSYSEGIFYNPSVIHLAEINRIKCFNGYNMTDDQMQYIVIVTFKKQLLFSSITSYDYVNAMHVYNDLVDILNITVKKDAVYNFCSCYNQCNTI